MPTLFSLPGTAKKPLLATQDGNIWSQELDDFGGLFDFVKVSYRFIYFLFDPIKNLTCKKAGSSRASKFRIRLPG
jgi:hypothetical protein